ncbi:MULTISPECIES: Nif11-like leader peptide family natural product precursor [unclassified Prochlorococcus]|uniref:Nif11-like leader peptide family natural product precursor n=1 Tax=unclassified Prochlorococcus TaxID=2627481 RepID=UPI0005337C24|nr:MULTISPECIES: Nif11-like leader peptide family natural product precursor [unclassified Prochlorococcus]KGG23272.1 hypothetical protein EV12_3123 [Prochlorococcus sp. MIT 0701]KGG25267.1 hypothetical protein EV13_3092 [Prochlorococcus sp. MIT 0702]KGG30296.1 hypothetical protein EV14_3032 [Prochlorococcus sp. MIT 0703]
MSEEQLKAFIAKVQADTSLQEQLKAEGADVVAIAKAAGFAITEAEVKAYGTRELNDEELGTRDLEGLAGGGGCLITWGVRPNGRRFYIF